jgi:hypothetical protein
LDCADAAIFYDMVGSLTIGDALHLSSPIGMLLVIDRVVNNVFGLHLLELFVA